MKKQVNKNKLFYIRVCWKIKFISDKLFFMLNIANFLYKNFMYANTVIKEIDNGGSAT